MQLKCNLNQHYFETIVIINLLLVFTNKFAKPEIFKSISKKALPLFCIRSKFLRTRAFEQLSRLTAVVTL